HHIDRRQSQIGTHAHFRHGDHVAFKGGVMHFAAREHVRQRVPDQLADAQHALRWPGRTVTASSARHWFSCEHDPEKLQIKVVRPRLDRGLFSLTYGLSKFYRVTK